MKVEEREKTFIEFAFVITKTDDETGKEQMKCFCSDSTSYRCTWKFSFFFSFAFSNRLRINSFLSMTAFIIFIISENCPQHSWTRKSPRPLKTKLVSRISKVVRILFNRSVCFNPIKKYKGTFKTNVFVS